MKLPLLRPAAAADLEEAALWYERQRAGLGREFLAARADEAVQRAMATPEGYSVVYKDRRRVLLQRFPYGLIYRLIDNQVIVLAVVHAKRHPSVSRSRP